MAEAAPTGLYKLTPSERVRQVAAWAELTKDETRLLRSSFASNAALDADTADGMIENVVGTFALPMGIATNFRINGNDVLVPMVIEEPSVVAAASNAAKMALPRGGFRARASEPIMIGQIHLAGVKDPASMAEEIIKRKLDVLRAARDDTSSLDRRGAGAVDLEVRTLRDGKTSYLAVHLLVDVGDAMGANAVNTRCERAARFLEKMTGGKARLRILSNLADRRLAMAEATFAAESLGGAEVVDRIVASYKIAEIDPYRCATHNKGIMNGVDAVALATGNDWRAIEAGAHSYAAKSGRYESLTRFHKNRQGDLVGQIELPMAVGIVGGSTQVNPMAKLALKILRVQSARALAETIACVGLAQNLAALLALSTEGIQAGHMRLHKRISRA
jgi:hydroxymethylglutaryl-CoA reductase